MYLAFCRDGTSGLAETSLFAGVRTVRAPVTPVDHPKASDLAGAVEQLHKQKEPPSRHRQHLEVRLACGLARFLWAEPAGSRDFGIHVI